MDEYTRLAEDFQQHRAHLRAVSYRMLGSLSEAEDAVQEAWLRLSRTDTTSVENLGAWLTTVVARVCLNMLRSRERRREEPFDRPVPDTAPAPGPDPEEELDPDVVLHADEAAGPTRAPVVLRGSRSVAKGASLAAARVRFTDLALVNGAVGVVMAPRGRLSLVLAFTIRGSSITAIDVIADPDRLDDLDLGIVDPAA